MALPVGLIGPASALGAAAIGPARHDAGAGQDRELTVDLACLRVDVGSGHDKPEQRGAADGRGICVHSRCEGAKHGVHPQGPRQCRETVRLARHPDPDLPASWTRPTRGSPSACAKVWLRP